MKRIGILYPSAGVAEAELQKPLPADVSLHVTRVPMSAPSYEALLQMAEHVEEGAKLLADAKVDVIAFACTAGSFIQGEGYDREIIARITHCTGLPSTTTTTAVVEGLKELKAKDIVLLTPYDVKINELEVAFLEGAGFKVLNHKGLGLTDCISQYEVEPSSWLDLIRGMRHPRADAYLVSCGGIRVVDIIERSEVELGRPVLTSNQALVWHCLRIMGIDREIKGFGRLLRAGISKKLG